MFAISAGFIIDDDECYKMFNKTGLGPVSRAAQVLVLSGLNMMAAILNKEQKAMGWCQNYEAKLKIVGGVIPRSNQQEADPTSIYITSVIMS